MKIKSNDKVKKLLRAYAFGLISRDDLISLVDKKPVELGAHLSWTLNEFSTLTELTNDIDIVKFVLKLQGKNKGLLSKLFERKNVLSMPVAKYLSLLKLAKDGVNDINTAIENIKQPDMSAEMKAAGFGRLNFGDLGIARMVGDFENIGTVAAYSLPMHVVIRSMEQLAAIKRCEKEHQNIIEAKSKLKK